MTDRKADPFSDRDIDDLVDAVERRGSERRPPIVEPTFVWVSLDRRIQGRLVDESDGGIGVLVPESAPFQVGFQVRVELAGEKRLAAIVYVNELEPGECRLGLEWE